MKGIMYGLAGVLTIACSSTPVRLDEAREVDAAHIYSSRDKPAGSATVIVVRDTGLVAAGCRLGFYVDGQVMADFETGEKATFYLPPGEYRLGSGPAKDAHGLCASDRAPTERETALRSGQTKTFRMFIDQDGNKDILPYGGGG